MASLSKKTALLSYPKWSLSLNMKRGLFICSGLLITVAVLIIVLYATKTLPLRRKKSKYNPLEERPTLAVEEKGPDICKKVTECVLTQTPIIFGKYGDGEYICVFVESHNGQNCDGDAYTGKKREGLIAAIRFMNSIDYAYIGRWMEEHIMSAWQSLCTNPIQWAFYESLFMLGDSPERDAKVLDLYLAIKNSPLKKIMVCNPTMKRSKALLNMDYMVYVPQRNWYDDHFEDVVSKVLACMEDAGMCIVITCCGMSAKVLQMRIAQLHPKGIYLDIGSGLDVICTKVQTRSYGRGYEHEHSIWKDELPTNWEEL